LWALQAKYCVLCGAELILAQVGGRSRKRCSSCKFVMYLNPASASAGVVLDDSNRVLLIRRALAPFEGSWALPAGYQEVDEDPRQTVVREVFEETGVRAEVVGLLEVLFIPDDPRKPANVTVFRCRQVGGTLAAGDDALEAAWFALDALPENLGFQSNAELLERVRRDLLGH
jgi:8-oxo-dGTP diphosphatase